MKWFLIIFVALLFSEVTSQTLQTVNSVHSISYDLEKGSVYIYLPEKIVDGKAFSGTVAIFTKGSSSREQAKNLAQLKKYKVIVFDKEFSAGSKTLKLNGTSAIANISLKNSAGKNLGSKRVNFDIKPALAPNTPLSLPGYIANSVNTSFYGVFDGNSENTTVTANGKALNVVAESPVQLSLRPENLASTSANIKIADGDNNYSGQCNSIYYTLKVGPTNLKRGQSTFFDATVHGVGTIQESLSYTVVNTTPNTVKLAGGNSQSFVINPGDGENGNWFHHFNIQSINTGSFSLTTNLVVPDTPYPNRSSTTEGVVTQETSSSAPANIDCRVYNQSFNVTASECAQLGGKIYDGTYETSTTEGEDLIESCEVSVTTTQDSNEVQLDISILSGSIPEMAVSVINPLNPNVQAAVEFLTGQEQSYSFSHKNQNFGRPSAANIETTLLFSNGSAQTINTEINFDGNPSFSIAQSPELNKIRADKNKNKKALGAAKNNKVNLTGERNKTQDRLRIAQEKYRNNVSQYRYLEKIDQSLEKARPAFADSLMVLIDSLNAFKKRTGGPLSATAAQIIEDNLVDTKKAQQDCMDQLRKLQQEQTNLSNEKETLKEQQKQIHRDIMALFRTTNMNFAGATRRDKNGKFHYQYGIVIVSGERKATYHKGSLPAQISSKVGALEKQMKLVTDKLNAITERLNSLPSEIKAKKDECDKLAQKVKDAEEAKKNKDAISAKDQSLNNEINKLCKKITDLLSRLKRWAVANKDTNLVSKINKVKCGENIWEQINAVINRKKERELEFERAAANARREMRAASASETEWNAKIKAAEIKIRNAQIALLASQTAEAKAAAIALAADQDKCLKIMKELGYEAVTMADVIDLYEISQDLKKAADEANAAMDNLRKAVELGEKHGMDVGDSKKWVKKTQKRLGGISKKLAKLKGYEGLAKTIQEYADDFDKLISSDGTPTQNAVAFGSGLKLMNKALAALAEIFPILDVFTAYFTFITESFLAIMDGTNSALRTQFEQLLGHVRADMDCNKLMPVCRSNEGDLAKIRDWAFKKYYDKEFGGLRSDETQAKKIIDEIVNQRMAECCFKRLQAIKAMQ